MRKLRDKLWELARRNHPEGELFSRPLLALRWLLYPLSTFYWRMSLNNGYQYDSDVWVIHGVKYSDMFFADLSRSAGGTYTITNTNGVIHVRRVGQTKG